MRAIALPLLFMAGTAMACEFQGHLDCDLAEALQEGSVASCYFNAIVGEDRAILATAEATEALIRSCMTLSGYELPEPVPEGG